jgi:fucose permease
VPRLARDSVTWLIYAQLGIWGYFVYGFGPVVPLLRDEQHVSRGVASLHSLALAVGAIIGGAIFPALARRYGRGRVMWLGLTGMAVGIAAFCSFRPIVFTLTSVLLLATCFTLNLNGVVSGLGEKHGPAGAAAIAEANALCTALGALAPLAIGATVAAGLTWRPAMAVAVVLVAGVAVVARLLGVRLEFSPPSSATSGVADSDHADRVAAARDGGSPPSGQAIALAPEPVIVPRPLPDPAATGRLPGNYWIAWTLMCLTGSIEVCLNLWAGDVLRSHAGMAASGAAGAVSGIVVGMCVSRIIGGRLALRVPPARLLLHVLGISLLGFVVFWTATVPWVAVCGLVLCGLGNGMHYPLAIGIALEVSKGRADQAAARAAYTLGVSFGVAPLALGAVADRIGAHSAFLFVPAFIAMAAVLVFLLGRRLDVRHVVEAAG